MSDSKKKMTNLYTIRKFGKFNFVLFAHVPHFNTSQTFFDATYYLDDPYDTGEIDINYLYDYGDVLELDFSTFCVESDVFITKNTKNEQFVFTKTGHHWRIDRIYKIKQRYTCILYAVVYVNNFICVLYGSSCKKLYISIDYTTNGTLIDIYTNAGPRYVLETS